MSSRSPRTLRCRWSLRRHCGWGMCPYTRFVYTRSHTTQLTRCRASTLVASQKSRSARPTWTRSTARRATTAMSARCRACVALASALARAPRVTVWSTPIAVCIFSSSSSRFVRLTFNRTPRTQTTRTTARLTSAKIGRASTRRKSSAFVATVRVVCTTLSLTTFNWLYWLVVCLLFVVFFKKNYLIII